MPDTTAMPTYEYLCPDGHRFDKFQRMSDPSEASCPECGEDGSRQISGGAGFLFKGDGFYITDSRSDDYKKRVGSEKAEASSSDKSKASKSSDGTGAKSKSPSTSSGSGGSTSSGSGGSGSSGSGGSGSSGSGGSTSSGSGGSTSSGSGGSRASGSG